MLIQRLSLVCCLAILPWTAASAQSSDSDSPRCKTATVDFGDGPRQAYFCQGPDGTWREQQGARGSYRHDDDNVGGGGGYSPPPAPPPQAYAPPPPPPPPPPPRVVATALDRQLDGIVRMDSQSWIFNRYDYGSMTNSKVVARSRKYGTATLYGEYTYNNGAQGWVKVETKGGTITCIQFWDDMCRPIGQSLSRRFLAGAMSGRSSGSGGSSSNPAADEERERQFQDMINANRQINENMGNP